MWTSARTNERLAALLLVGPLALAGCIGTETTTGEEGIRPAEAGYAGQDVALVETVAEWTGRIPVGALAELPAHFPETAPLVEPLWPDGMRPFEITELPETFTLEMEWTGAAGSQVQLMVEAPADNDGEIHYWAAPGPGEFTTERRLCLRVPAEGLATGHWQVMPHTLVGADIEFTITAHLVGGMGRYADGHEGWMSFQEYLERKGDGTMQGHAADPCDW